MAGARNDSVECPVCGRHRSKRAMEQHVLQAHTPHGVEVQREAGYKGQRRKGRGRVKTSQTTLGRFVLGGGW